VAPPLASLCRLAGLRHGDGGFDPHGRHFSGGSRGHPKKNAAAVCRGVGPLRAPIALIWAQSQAAVVPGAPRPLTRPGMDNR